MCAAAPALLCVSELFLKRIYVEVLTRTSRFVLKQLDYSLSTIARQRFLVHRSNCIKDSSSTCNGQFSPTITISFFHCQF